MRQMDLIIEALQDNKMNFWPFWRLDQGFSHPGCNRIDCVVDPAIVTQASV